MKIGLTDKSIKIGLLSHFNLRRTKMSIQTNANNSTLQESINQIDAFFVEFKKTNPNQSSSARVAIGNDEYLIIRDTVTKGDILPFALKRSDLLPNFKMSMTLTIEEFDMDFIFCLEEIAKIVDEITVREEAIAFQMSNSFISLVRIQSRPEIITEITNVMLKYKLDATVNWINTSYTEEFSCNQESSIKLFCLDLNADVNFLGKFGNAITGLQLAACNVQIPTKIGLPRLTNVSIDERCTLVDQDCCCMEFNDSNINQIKARLLSVSF